MIIEFFLNLIFGLFDKLLLGIQVLTLPLNFVNVLGDITIYGCWILGSDLFVLFIGVVSSFFLLRLSIGFVEWAYHLIPFC